MKEQLAAWVDAHAEELVEETQKILRIPSVRDPATAGPDAPFGQGCAQALSHTLALCARFGLRTQNFSGYAGHAEFGPEDAPDYVAALGHLDVVPPGADWSVDPWGATRRDGWLFARGASDDKGPTFAALFGARAVHEVAGDRLSRRIRLIFGCDEESEWKCMDHYFGAAGQPRPALAFTPDAGFPLYHAEKGAFTATVEKTVPPADAPVQIAALHSGLRPNMVPDEASAQLRGDDGALRAAGRILRKKSVTLQATHGALTVTARGRSAHGATPHRGRNAAVVLARALQPVTAAPWLDELIARAPTDGSGIGIAGSDRVTGALTANLGVVDLQERRLRLTFNIRYPATWDESVLSRFQETMEAGGWNTVALHHTPPLYVPLDQEPVKTLLRLYREETGDRSRPKTMGGRTYATTVAPVGVAFGPARKGDPDVAHRPDERFAVERLVQCARLYACALYALAR